MYFKIKRNRKSNKIKTYHNDRKEKLGCVWEGYVDVSVKSHEPGGPIPRCDYFCCSVDLALCRVLNRHSRGDHQRSSRLPTQPALHTSPFECNRTP